MEKRAHDPGFEKEGSHPAAEQRLTRVVQTDMQVVGQPAVRRVRVRVQHRVRRSCACRGAVDRQTGEGLRRTVPGATAGGVRRAAQVAAARERSDLEPPVGVPSGDQHRRPRLGQLTQIDPAGACRRATRHARGKTGISHPASHVVRRRHGCDAHLDSRHDDVRRRFAVHEVDDRRDDRRAGTRRAHPRRTGRPAGTAVQRIRAHAAFTTVDQVAIAVGEARVADDPADARHARRHVGVRPREAAAHRRRTVIDDAVAVVVDVVARLGVTRTRDRVASRGRPRAHDVTRAQTSTHAARANRSRRLADAVAVRLTGRADQPAHTVHARLTGRARGFAHTAVRGRSSEVGLAPIRDQVVAVVESVVAHPATRAARAGRMRVCRNRAGRSAGAAVVDVARRRNAAARAARLTARTRHVGDGTCVVRVRSRVAATIRNDIHRRVHDYHDVRRIEHVRGRPVDRRVHADRDIRRDRHVRHVRQIRRIGSVGSVERIGNGRVQNIDQQAAVARIRRHDHVDGDIGGRVARVDPHSVHHRHTVIDRRSVSRNHRPAIHVVRRERSGQIQIRASREAADRHPEATPVPPCRLLHERLSLEPAIGSAY